MKEFHAYDCINDKGECDPGESSDCQSFGGCPICDEFHGGEKSTHEKMLEFKKNYIIESENFHLEMDEFLKTPEGQSWLEKVHEIFKKKVIIP